MASAAALGAVGRGFESLYSDFFLPMQIANLVWDPPTDLFTIPYVDHPVKIYGFLFALGFFLGYLVFKKLVLNYLLSKGEEESRAKEKSRTLADRITWMSVLGAVVGARLGHVLFYDFDRIITHPMSLLSTWEGGLASHGGAVGLLIMIAIFWLRSKKDLHEIPFLSWFDIYVVPVALGAVFIRLGNFFNQEILGTYTTMPWGVIFPHAMDGLPPFPRHPIPLYEAACYLFSFFLLYKLINRPHKPGSIVGLFFILIFGSRFIIEFWKSSQMGLFDDWILQTGQLLSIPFISAGLYLLLRKPSVSCQKVP